MENYPSGLTADQIDGLEAQLAGQQTSVNLSCIPSALAVAFLTHWLLVSASYWFLGHDNVAGFKIPYQPVIWWFLPASIALLLSFEITLQVWSLFIGKKTVDLYTQWASHQPKSLRGRSVYYDMRKWSRRFALVVCLPIGGLSVLALNMHTAFGSDGIHEYGFAFARPVSHSYSAIRRIAIVSGYLSGRDHEWIGKESVVLDFADGHRWEQAEFDEARLPSNLDEISKILREKTPLDFVWANTVEDLDRH